MANSLDVGDHPCHQIQRRTPLALARQEDMVSHLQTQEAVPRSWSLLVVRPPSGCAAIGACGFGDLRSDVCGFSHLVHQCWEQKQWLSFPSNRRMWLRTQRRRMIWYRQSFFVQETPARVSLCLSETRSSWPASPPPPYLCRRYPCWRCCGTIQSRLKWSQNE